jgi:16S rRNA (cytosine967-C5)-methyltransferase
VLDACAAPGGKTAHILELAEVDLLALDADANRCRRIDENLARLQLRASVKAGDCRSTKDWWDGRPFDRILADVPCSASGVVRRHPDAKRLRREADIARFAATQRQILDALWPTLAPGGTLLYATCSVFPEENSAQISAFLSRHGDARAGESAQLLPDDDHDGFFYAALVKAA